MNESLPRSGTTPSAPSQAVPARAPQSADGYFARWSDRAVQVGSLLCVGLDPHPELLEQPSAKAARDHCLRLIDQTAEFALAFKPNSAFFEAYGGDGWTALKQVIAAVPSGVPVVLDAKRGDIRSTATAYARAVFDQLGASAVTLSPYLGRDSIEPFIEDPGRGVFLLCKSSNPGSADLQLHGGPDDPLYLRVARLAAAWNQAGNLGLVAGATDPAALRAVRRAAPDLWLLAPGVGAQGGELRAAVEAGLRPDGLGLAVAVSRTIATAAAPAREARRLRDRIHEIAAG